MIIIITLCILGISILYFLVIVIWWEIVDYNEFKFTKKEKKELKKIRKSYKCISTYFYHTIDMKIFKK